MRRPAPLGPILSCVFLNFARLASVVEITDAPLDLDAILASVASPASGATVLFVGTTRQFTDAKETERLSYTAYTEMAVRQMKLIESQARARWPLEGCTLVHRLGEVPIGDASVAVAVSSPHRREAFEAANWLIDILKQVVPVWKKEHWQGDLSGWIHPGLPLHSDENPLQ